MYTLSIEKMISAAHQLRDYEGPCAKLHGHNWKIKVVVCSETLDKVGIVIDFEELDKLTWQVIGRFDHANFNDFPPFDDLNPTAENIARFVYHELAASLPQKVHLKNVVIWENESYVVEYAE